MKCRPIPNEDLQHLFEVFSVWCVFRGMKLRSM